LLDAVEDRHTNKSNPGGVSMQSISRFAGRIVLVIAATVLGTVVAMAQSYPSKPIRIIVPYPAGGTSDILARAIGPGITAALGQPVLIENKPGSTGNVGADLVAKSPPTATPCCWPTSARSRSAPASFPRCPLIR
jgi:tripartite-type tricarboxylate transporter receptor subunit TctC